MDVNNISNVFSNAKIDSFTDNSNDKSKSINFAEMLNSAINKMNDDQINSDKMGELLAVGKVDNIHEVMIASQKAELTLNLAIEIKSKIMEAYKEIMRLQI